MTISSNSRLTWSRLELVRVSIFLRMPFADTVVMSAWEISSTVKTSVVRSIQAVQLIHTERRKRERVKIKSVLVKVLQYENKRGRSERRDERRDERQSAFPLWRGTKKKIMPVVGYFFWSQRQCLQEGRCCFQSSIPLTGIAPIRQRKEIGFQVTSHCLSCAGFPL